MPINSKAKGSDFERKVAKKLTEWSGQKFNRTPMSGALHWENDKRVVSDIVPPQTLNWPFSIECKKVEYPWDFSFILKGTSMFWEHLKQATRDANDEGLLPMLVFSKNHRETYVAIPSDVYVLLYHGKNKPTHLAVSYDTNTIRCHVIILDFDEFLKDITLEDVLNLANLCK